MKNKKKNRTTFAKEFIKKFVPILLLLLIVLTSYMYIKYKEIVNKAEDSFNETISIMCEDMDQRYKYAAQDFGFLWDETDIQNLERGLAIAMSLYGTTGDYYRPDIGLMLNDNFTDFAANLYKKSSDTNSCERIKDTEDFIYMVEAVNNEEYPASHVTYRIYTCPVAEIQEAYEFYLDNRHRTGSLQSVSGYSSIDSFYINYETGEFKPKQVSLYTIDEKKDTKTGTISKQEILEKTITYEPTDLDNFDYVNCNDPNFYNYYTLQGHNFYGPYFACSKKDGAANIVLQQTINENNFVLNSLENVYKLNKSHHGLVLEFSSCIALDFIPFDIGFDVIKHAYDSEHPDEPFATFYPSQENLAIKSQYVHSYVACVAATMDLRELYGKKIILSYLYTILASFIISLLLAKLAYTKYKLQYQMLDYRKALTDAMAHDLKSPLMAISGYAENLKENIYTDNKEIYADKILTNIEDMNRIITDILELSKAETDSTNVALENISLRPLFEDVFFTYEEEMDNRGTSYEIQGNSSAKANPRIMKRVIDNLINNAITYGLDHSTIAVNIEKYGFTIKNTYDEKEIDEAFTTKINELTKPFVKGNKSRTNHKGSGLGLTIVKELLNAQGYKLDIILCDSNFIIKVWS